jgi:HSP20 family protein
MTTQTQAAPGRTPETGARSQIEPPEPFQPAVDIRDSGAAVTLVADVPGARTDGITVAFEEGVLTVEAAVAARQLPGRIVQREYGIGDYRRTFRLGNGFDASQIVAEYRHGVLTIHVPRLAAVRPRKIEVRPA